MFPGHGDFDEAANTASPNPHTVQVDISCAAANQAQVQIRWAYNSASSAGYSHYYWGLDDVRIFENPLISNLGIVQVLNGTCHFEISGFVFHDLNADGDWDADEYPLSFQEVTVPALGVTMITNDEGAFTVPVPAGLYDVFVTETEDFPFNTTPNPHTVWTNDGSSLYTEFGLSIDFPDFEICVDFYPSGGGFLCDGITNSRDPLELLGLMGNSCN